MSRKKYPPIPPHVRVTSKRTFEVVHIEQFKNKETMGECRFEPTQIVLKKGQTPKEEFSTFLHECIHAVAVENDVELTETQVLKLEKGFLRLLLLNGWV